MGYFRNRRSAWAVGLALFSLFLQVLIPLGQALAASFLAESGYSNQIWICTHYGFKLAPNNPDGKAPPAQGGNVDCPACMAYAIGMTSLANASEIILPVPSFTRAESIVITYTGRHSVETPSGYLTRAPPVSV
jgi:hypothetical protein